jgi:hypothetical protein
MCTPPRSAGSHDAIVRRIVSRPSRTVRRIPLTGASEVSFAHAAEAVRSKYSVSQARRSW